ncbi:MAG: hypothetical protein ACP5G2_06675 [Candidatus Bipolaricaulaceae bacterium]
MRAFAVGVVVMSAVLAAAGLVCAQLERAQDLAYGGKPFNPGDAGVVMRAILQDNDGGNDWPVYLTKLTVTDLGTAGEAEIESVEVRLEVPGASYVLARGAGFPLSQVLLPLPPLTRSLPDDGQGMLVVAVVVAEGAVDGHTVQPRVQLWWSEGDKGGTVVIADSVPEKFVVEDSFRAELAPGPAGGILNPGDVLPVLRVRLEDTADVNLTGLSLAAVRVDGPAGFAWTVDTGTSKLEIPAGRSVELERSRFVAFDEGEGLISLWVTVPVGFLPREPVSVAPGLSLTVQEGVQRKVFKFADPEPDMAVGAGLESLSVTVPQEGEVVATVPSVLAYSRLALADADVNRTPLRVDALELAARGTVSGEIDSVEVFDGDGNFVGFAPGLAPIELAAPGGDRIILEDDQQIGLQVSLTFAGPVPRGGSLLLEHRLTVEEKMPAGRLPLAAATTDFRGVQAVLPGQAIFFGQPKIMLRAGEHGFVLSTDGETVGALEGVLRYTPTAGAAVSLIAQSPYRLTRQEVDADKGEVAFRVECGRAQARAGDLVAVQVALAGRLEAPTVEVALQLTAATATDVAGITLPLSLSPDRAVLSVTAPLLALEVVPGVPSEVMLTVDSPVVSSMKALLRYDPAQPIALVELAGAGPYRAMVVDSDAERGVVAVQVSIGQGEQPAAGRLFAARFSPTIQLPHALAAAIQLEIVELVGIDGQPLPYALAPEAVAVQLE